MAATTSTTPAVSFSLPSPPHRQGAPRRRAPFLLRAASTAAPPSPDLSIQLSPRASPPASTNGAATALGRPVAASFARDRAEDLQAEARAMARAAGATVYSPELLASRYGSRPFKARAPGSGLHQFWT
jgi:aarF domain-containing kinase